jgi:dipeptidyl aminopeptidase/acylaminoacyl peptidase
MSHDDMWLMRRLAAPTVSPDGELVLVTVVAPAYDPQEESTDLWVIRADGRGDPRQLTNSKGAEVGATWSPDGRRIAFVFREEGEFVPQLYVADIEAAKVARLTNLSTGVRSPKWSPDGKSIAFVSDVFPGAVNDAQNRLEFIARRDSKTSARVYDGFPIRLWDRWLDERRPHLLLIASEPGAEARDLFAQWPAAQLPSFGGRINEVTEVIEFAWAPDGRSIVFVATLARDQGAHAAVVDDLYSIDINASQPRRLTDDGLSYSEPVFAPDGTWFVAGASEVTSRKVYTATRLVRFPWPFDPAGAIRIAGGLDRDPRRHVVSRDNEGIFFTAEDSGHEKIYRAPANGGAASVWFDPGDGVVSALDIGGTRRSILAVVTEAASSPPEVAVITPGRKLNRISSFNRSRARQLDLPPVEEFWFTSSKGRRIHSLLIRPAGFDASRKYPVFVSIHGGPHSMARDGFMVRWNYHLFAGSDYVVLATNYSGSTGFGEAFSQGTQGDPLKTPGDEILEALDAALAKFPFLDGRRVAAGGASYGGHLTGWLQATTTRFRCLVSHAGMVNVTSQWGTSDVIYHRELNMNGPVWEQGEIWTTQNPARFADRNATGEGWVTPMLVTACERDFRVPINNAIETWSYLQRLEIPSRLIVFPDENHWILKGENSRFWYSEVKAWLDKWTLPEVKPAA